MTTDEEDMTAEGFLAAVTADALLSNESRKAFRLLQQQYIETFHPGDFYARVLLEDIIYTT
ncbi:MAG: hypothetical protein JO237_05880, partial [Pseudolabrys sp.]|nr:hypothetical protein [Pseudolabrys sp.]